MRIGFDGPELHQDAGRWPRYVDGGYPLIYYFADGAVVCADCASGENGSRASETQDDEQWRLVGADVFYEGPAETCSHCEASIESAYGDPDAGPEAQ